MIILKLFEKSMPFCLRNALVYTGLWFME